MTVSLAYLGPAGTYTEAAAIGFLEAVRLADKPTRSREMLSQDWLKPYGSIAQTLQAVVTGETDLAIVPVENSIQGSVTVTLDLMWQLDLIIQQAIILPIRHALISFAPNLQTVQTVYSHPQALAQCQNWLAQNLPAAQARSTNSTTEALDQLADDPTLAAISSQRAAELYELPIIAQPINDYADNCTRFWVVARPDFVTTAIEGAPSKGAPSTFANSVFANSVDIDPINRRWMGRYISIAFSLPANAPGALLDPLQTIASRGMNMSRIESRPTKRSLGEYLFFIDLEAVDDSRLWQAAYEDLKHHTEVLKVFGTYGVLDLTVNNTLAKNS